MSLRKTNAAVVILMLLGLIFTVQAQALIVLPDPNTIITEPPFPTGTPIWNTYTEDWERVASQHDDFYAYSGKLNDVLYPTAGYDQAVGTGTLDLLLYTGAGTKDRNQNIGPTGTFDFEDPMSAPAGSEQSFAGWWGQNDQNDDDIPDTQQGGAGKPINGPVLVDDVLRYLQSYDPNLSIPVFIFDMNQQGTEGKDDDPNWNVYIAGEVYLVDSKTGLRVDGAEWAFDNIPGSEFNEPDPSDLPSNPYDPDNPWVTAIGPLQIGSYLVNHNKGGGKLDFLGYAPTMNLNNANWLNKEYWFVTDFRLAGINDGGEELFLTGAYAPSNVIPEPASLSLLGLGLLGILGLKKRAIV